MSLDSKEVTKVLHPGNRYNEKSLPAMEALVQKQVTDNLYNLEVNLAVLKQYQFQPHLLKADIVEKIFVKAIAALPNPDFRLCQYLIPVESRTENMDAIEDLAYLLETCQFQKFWEARGKTKLFDGVKGFDEAIRNYVLDVVAATYQRVQKPVLADVLALSDKPLTKLVKAAGWKVEGDEVTCPLSEFNQAQEKKIEEKITFDQVVFLTNMHER